MTAAELREIQEMSWIIKGITRKLNKVARDMKATTDELRAMRGDFGIQPRHPQLRVVTDEEGDDA
jgi:hypothetical protein